MTWYAVRPRDPADPRWPLPGKAEVVLKAADADEAREKFEQAYPSAPFGTPKTPVPDGTAGFSGDDSGLVVAETSEPAAPEA